MITSIMCRESYNFSGTVQTWFTELCLRKEILTTGNDSKVKALQEENQSLKKEIESLKDEFGRIAATCLMNLRVAAINSMTLK